MKVSDTYKYTIFDLQAAKVFCRFHRDAPHQSFSIIRVLDPRRCQVFFWIIVHTLSSHRCRGLSTGLVPLDLSIHTLRISLSGFGRQTWTQSFSFQTPWYVRCIGNFFDFFVFPSLVQLPDSEFSAGTSPYMCSLKIFLSNVRVFESVAVRCCPSLTGVHNDRLHGVSP